MKSRYIKPQTEYFTADSVEIIATSIIEGGNKGLTGDRSEAKEFIFDLDEEESDI